MSKYKYIKNSSKTEVSLQVSYFKELDKDIIISKSSTKEVAVIKLQPSSLPCKVLNDDFTNKSLELYKKLLIDVSAEAENVLKTNTKVQELEGENASLKQTIKELEGEISKLKK